MNKFGDINISDPEQEQSNLLSEIDIGKILRILRRSLIWILLVNVLVFTLAYLYLRYTKPLYESSSSLKLTVKENQRYIRTFGLLGGSGGNDIKELLGELEIIKSDIIINEVVKRLNLEISYYAKGSVLTTEQYDFSPFKVNVEVKNVIIKDIPIYVNFLNDRQYQLSFRIGEQDHSYQYKIGKPATNPFFTLTLLPNRHLDDQVKTLNYYFVINSQEALRNYIADNLRPGISNKDAQIIAINFVDHNQQKAHDVVAAIDTAYMEKSVEQKNKSNRKRIEFLNTELKHYEDSLIAYEFRLQNFFLENKTKDVSEKLQKSIENIQELTIDRSKVAKQLAVLDELWALVQAEEDSKELRAIILKLDNEMIQRKVEEIFDLYERQELLTLRAYPDKTFESRKTQKKVELVKEEALKTIDAQKEITTDKLRDINVSLIEVQSSLEGLPIKGRDFNRINRLYSSYSNYYNDLLNKRTELAIAGAGVVPECIILSPANVPKKPISPNVLFIYVVTGAIGFFLSMTIVGTKYLLHNTILHQSDLEKAIQVPILGSIPEYRRKKLENTSLVVAQNPKSSINEALRTIRTNLDFMLPTGRGIFNEQSCTLISITSTVSGEGKTFVASNLGGIIAMSDLKVIVLDFDMRKPKLHLAFKADNEQGISSILIGKKNLEDCIHQSEIRNLDFITSGPTPPNPSELILRDDFSLIINQLKERYDVVIIDTPPVGLVTDALLIMQKVDMPIYVVRAHYSKKAFLKNINRLVRDNNFTNMAIVLNSVKPTIGSNIGYGYGYGGYYSEGYYDEGKPKKQFDIGKLLSRISRSKN